MKIYHNPRCSKSRETLQLLHDNGAKPEVLEYLKEPPTKAELKELIALLKIRPADLVRKNEPDFVAHFKGKTLTNTQWIAAMAKYPKLIERPIVVQGNKAMLGRPPSSVLELL